MLNGKRQSFYSSILAMTFFAGLLFAISGEAATVYMWRDDNGLKQYTDHCPPGEKCVAKKLGTSDGSDSGGGTRNKGKSWKHTTTTDTGTTDTGTSTSGDDSASDTTADSGTDDTTPDTTTDSEPTTTGDAATSTDTDDTASTSTDPATDASALLQWDPVLHSALQGYRLFYAKGSTAYQGIDVGNSTTYSMTGLESGARYYFRVAAYDSSGNQSDFSNEVYKDMP